METRNADIIIVGAGIIGLAHAHMAGKSGKKVVVFERNPAAVGASIANFGMLSVAERWYGVYAKHHDKPYIRFRPDDSVEVVTGLGGAGMTLSFGVAAETFSLLSMRGAA
ncbi:MAG: FAD-dependent oxidoreductase [Edaphobacter sp.]